jgi:hypothetical protein
VNDSSTLTRAAVPEDLRAAFYRIWKRGYDGAHAKWWDWSQAQGMRHFGTPALVASGALTQEIVDGIVRVTDVFNAIYRGEKETEDFDLAAIIAETQRISEMAERLTADRSRDEEIKRLLLEYEQKMCSEHR